jgi:hypothetical protein
MFMKIECRLAISQHAYLQIAFTRILDLTSRQQDEFLFQHLGGNRMYYACATRVPACPWYVGQ